MAHMEMMPILKLVFWLALGAAQQAADGSVEGAVRRTGTTEGIEGVEVTLVSGALKPPRVLTDKDGHFSFASVAPGRYTIRIQRDGYLLPGSTLSVAGFQSAPEYLAYGTGSAVAAATAGPMASAVDVGASEHVTGLTYYLIPGGTISGRILDPLGRPAVGADVYALRLVYQEGAPTVSPVKSASSNDRGEYRMFWLEPGTYIIRAEKVLPSGPARAYYPGTSSAAAAVQVRVSEGAESSKIDISIHKDQTFKISGTVTNMVAGMQNQPTVASAPAAEQTPEQAVPAPQFYLSPIDTDETYDGVFVGTNVLTSAQDRADGRFEIRDVRSGSYTLISVVRDRSTPPRYFTGRTQIDVGFQDVKDVSLVIGPGRDLRGRIVYPGNVPPATPLLLQLRPKGLLPVLPLASNLSVTTEADGTFSILNVSNLPYSVSVSPLPKDAYVADLRQGSFSIFDVGTIVVGERANEDFEIVLDSPGAVINGSVPASPQQLAAGVAVVLMPDERRRENVGLYRRTNASPSGAFSFAGIAPGRYTLFAWENIPVGAEFNLDFMDLFRDEGKVITLTPGDTSTVELRLINE